MNGADFLRGLFGFRNNRLPTHPSDEDGQNPGGGREDPNGRDDFHFSWSWNSQDDLFGRNDEGVHQDIFGHFEEVFRQFDQLFSGSFGRVPFAAIPGGPGIPRDEEDAPAKHSPRDYMLKEPFQDPPTDRQPHTDSITPPAFFGSIFGPIEKPRREDKDLDSEVKKGDLSFLFKDGNSLGNKEAPNEDSPMKSLIPGRMPPEGSIDRVQVYTFSNRNGCKEEKRTYKDETGTEVTTVTRSLGSKQYSHTTKKHPDGRKEHTEDFINMSDSERDNFTRNWSNQAHGANVEAGKNINQYVRDLFRIGFPGFPSK